ncbi:unnamed protein product [Brassicogethes aeneus]|uniref:Mitochondrial import inner membrane translocase subunit Tim23 n=1 Tax=Brassicogethes aeneus TaxID=1431903 RepID=A0A9P0ANE9_BRAAE|nr:unnamed protein product [Brassicogethes aeneus]
MSSMNDSSDIYAQNYGGSATAPGNFRPFASPYLNYDPGYIPATQPEFIFLEGANKQRGRFELAFGQIGASCMVGAGLGGASGFYNGLKATTMAGQTGKLRRTQMINHIMKKGSATANTFGSVAVIYSGFGVILQLVRGTDDDLNTVIAATATGLLYKSSAGLRKCGMGGAIGFGVSALFALWNSRDKLSGLQQFNPAQR